MANQQVLIVNSHNKLIITTNSSTVLRWHMVTAGNIIIAGVYNYKKVQLDKSLTSISNDCHGQVITI